MSRLSTCASVGMATMSLACAVQGAAFPPPAAGPPTGAPLSSVGKGYFYGSGNVFTDQPGDTFVLSRDAHAEIDLSNPLTTRSGSLIAWVMPLWPDSEARSHTLLSLRWQGEDQSYMTLSQGWWEPQGAGKLYFILSNLDQAFCHMPGTFNYTIFAQQRWTMLAATWTSGKPGYVKLFVDGQKICDRRMVLAGERWSVERLYVGSDRGASDQRGRASDFRMAGLQVFPKPLSDSEIVDRYRYGGGDSERKWVAALIPGKTPSAPPREARVMFDEDTHWVKSRLEIDKTILRVKEAGFNVYVPCIWNGAEASFITNLAPVSSAYRHAHTEPYDPLKYLIEAAHREGIAVHLWFDVMRRETTLLPPQFSGGAPPGAFNVQDPGFRAYFAKFVRDAAERYQPDGVNLDYIRSMGVCSSKACEDEYFGRYKRSLKRDWDLQESGTRVSSVIDWNTNAVSSLVYELARQLRTDKPGMFISVDTIPFDQSRLHQGVDVQAWIAAKAIDSVVYMAYDTPIDVDNVSRASRRLTPEKTVILMKNFDMADDQVIDNSGRVIVDYVNLVRALWPGAGVGFYHYPHLTSEQAGALKSSVFSIPVDSGWLRHGF